MTISLKHRSSAENLLIGHNEKLTFDIKLQGEKMRLQKKRENPTKLRRDGDKIFVEPNLLYTEELHFAEFPSRFITYYSTQGKT